MERTAAVDYGRRRIGLAVADPLGITVRGLETIDRVEDPADGARRTAAALRAEQVTRILVGLPLHASGDESEMSAEARIFGALLATESGLPVAVLDETLTTWEAEEAVRARGIKLREAKQSGLLDQQAAVAMLRGWLRDGEQWPSEANDSAC
ncbi:MAG: Holliday junction resolvase RuvX [Planctomycetota bacterium]|nr:Holliday junction resolvase RuvX [Planctomycetota bacterium]